MDGTILELNYKTRSKDGGGFAKSVPKPKDMHKEENKKFEAGLSNRQFKLKEIYEDIRTRKDGELLVSHVKEGTIKPDEKDGLGRCPLIFAIDCELDVEICKQLVELGCDPQSADNLGDTLLHYAVNLDCTEIEQWLVNEIKFDKSIKNNDGQTAYD